MNNQTKSVNCPFQSQGYYFPQCNRPANSCQLQVTGHYSYFECNCSNISLLVAQEVATNLGGKVIEQERIFEIILI